MTSPKARSHDNCVESMNTGLGRERILDAFWAFWLVNQRARNGGGKTPLLVLSIVPCTKAS